MNSAAGRDTGRVPYLSRRAEMALQARRESSGKSGLERMFPTSRAAGTQHQVRRFSPSRYTTLVWCRGRPPVYRVRRVRWRRSGPGGGGTADRSSSMYRRWWAAGRGSSEDTLSRTVSSRSTTGCRQSPGPNRASAGGGSVCTVLEQHISGTTTAAATAAVTRSAGLSGTSHCSSCCGQWGVTLSRGRIVPTVNRGAVRHSGQRHRPSRAVRCGPLSTLGSTERRQIGVPPESGTPSPGHSQSEAYAPSGNRPKTASYAPAGENFTSSVYTETDSDTAPALVPNSVRVDSEPISGFSSSTSGAEASSARSLDSANESIFRPDNAISLNATGHNH